MSKDMTGADMVIEALVDQGVEHIFGYPGGAVAQSWHGVVVTRGLDPRVHLLKKTFSRADGLPGQAQGQARQ